jgi:uncharacterized protein (DUF1697 family)
MIRGCKYLALLRGVNVGGKSKIKMADLQTTLTQAGFDNVVTYIQSGNIIFSSQVADRAEISKRIRSTILEGFNLDVDVVVLSHAQWSEIITNAPKWWGVDGDWKHNLLVLIPPYDMAQTMAAIGVLKPDIESAVAGDGVIYQSMSIKLFGRTTTGKLSSSPIYKKMTVRNYNTATKLLRLLESDNG